MPMGPETIIRAAIEWDGSLYFLGPSSRHHDLIRYMSKLGLGPECMHKQGFLTSNYRFVDRFEALQIAIAAKQLLPTARRCDKLYSEDVW